jgi:6-phosphogluconolactonase
MLGIEKAPYKVGFRRSLLKSCIRRYAAIVGIGFFAFQLESLRAEFVYVANKGDNNVSAYSINPTTGALKPVAGSPFPAGNTPLSIAVGGLRFVYVTNEITSNFSFNGNVSAYRINPTTGALTPVAGSPFPAGNTPISIAVEPSGRFVYVANDGDNNVSAYRIGENGALTPVPGSPFAAGAGPRSVAVAP